MAESTTEGNAKGKRVAIEASRPKLENFAEANTDLVLNVISVLKVLNWPASNRYF